jgi:hypothetical protein
MEIMRLEQIATAPVGIAEAVGEEIVAASGSAAPANATGADAPPPAESPASGPATDVAVPAPAAPVRVRVRTPGGVFFETITAREGPTITLVTDEGSRIVLESDDIEPAPLAKAVVKRDAATRPSTKDAPRPAPAVDREAGGPKLP